MTIIELIGQSAVVFVVVCAVIVLGAAVWDIWDARKSNESQSI